MCGWLLLLLLGHRRRRPAAWAVAAVACPATPLRGLLLPSRPPLPRCWAVRCASSIHSSECSALSPASGSLHGPLISACPRCCLRALQAFAHLLRSNAGVVARSPNLGCCRDCMRVRQRVAAALRARAAWHNAWALISTLRLEAMEQGHPKPPLVLPYLDVQPHLAEGVPEELPASSIDRCAACQKELQEVRRLRRLCVLRWNAAVRSLFWTGATAAGARTRLSWCAADAGWEGVPA